MYYIIACQCAFFIVHALCQPSLLLASLIALSCLDNVPRVLHYSTSFVKVTGSALPNYSKAIETKALATKTIYYISVCIPMHALVPSSRLGPEEEAMLTHIHGCSK